MGGRLYLLSLIEVVICQDKLIRTEDVASRHNDKQQHGPNDANLQITTPIGPCVVDCDGKSQTTRSSDPLHIVPTVSSLLSTSVGLIFSSSSLVLSKTEDSLCDVASPAVPACTSTGMSTFFISISLSMVATVV